MSELTVTPDLSKAIAEATSPEAIKAALLAEAESQLASAAEKTAADAAKVVTDKAAADAAKIAADAATAAAAAATQPFTETITINGKEFVFEAPTELELSRAIANAYKVAYAVQEPVATVDAAAETAAAAKLAEEQAAARTELELQFKRGEITANDYIEKSGAIKDYLEKQGVPLEKLKASIEAGESASYEKSWETATETFKTSAIGQDWPGGAKNLKLIGQRLVELKLTDADDKVAALATAWNAMKNDGMYFPAETPVKTNAELAAEAATKAASEAVAAITASKTETSTATTAATSARTTSSSMFGQSSGVATAVNAPTAGAAAAKFDIPKDATPEQILEHWKAAQVAAGKDPNVAFHETFNTKR